MVRDRRDYVLGSMQSKKKDRRTVAFDTTRDYLSAVAAKLSGLVIDNRFILISSGMKKNAVEI